MTVSGSKKGKDDMAFFAKFVGFCTISMVLLTANLILPYSVMANEQESSFMPTWSLLTQEQKQTFIAGYLHGWRDARRVAQIVGEHLAENPEEVHKSMEIMQGIYDLSNLRPETIANHIDQFYKDSENSRAPLSKAISSARTN